MTTEQSRAIAVLSSGRQDWGILRSLCEAIEAEAGLRLVLVVGGMHLSDRYGHTVDAVRADGFKPAAELDWLSATDAPRADTQAAGALAAMGAWLEDARPNALVLVGDRLETAAAALAATLAAVPIVHLHGGEQTLGAFDDALRHAITKLAHLHLVSHEEHARRVVALGEDPASVHVIGAPGLDNLHRADLPGRSDLEAIAGVPLPPPLVLVTVHPATLDPDPAGAARAVAATMDAVPATYLVTLPNSDPGAAQTRQVMLDAVTRDPARRVALPALGERAFWGALRIADAMLGNSSSALIEAPAVRLPVVDIGDRQAGRRHEPNRIHAPASGPDVTSALRRALDPAFRAGIPPLDPRLADGRAGARAARIIAAWHPPSPPRKPPVRIDP